MDGYTIAIVGIIVVLGAFIVYGVATVDLPASWVIIEKPKAVEPFLWSMPAFRRDVGKFFLYSAQWALYGAIAVWIIAAGVRLGLSR